MAPRKDASSPDEGIPFGALERPETTAVDAKAKRPKRRATKATKSTAKDAAKDSVQEPGADEKTAPESKGASKSDAAPDNGRSERKARTRRSPRRRKEEPSDNGKAAPAEPVEAAAAEPAEAAQAEGEPRREGRRKRWQKRRRGRRKRDGQRPDGGAATQTAQAPRAGQDRARGARPAPGGEIREIEGMLILEKANHGRLRRLDNQLLPTRHDVHVAPRIVQKLGLREGSIIKGVYGRGHGKNKYDLVEVHSVDGKDPKEVRNLPSFKSLVSIDPDFHYAVGDGVDDVNLRIVDLICPVGRGQRGLIVAPPRTGKTILLQKFAHAIEEIYPEVRLMVLLVDERPEEATEWRRTVKNGEVYVSTNDELHKNHVELCEAVWRRCRRLVELGEDVVLLLDSITRMGRAYNNVYGNSGKTMSGGLDTRALERPKQFFGSARNTETAGSLTILATTLIETGSMMDKIIFEEFKGTGNMELVLSRKLADRRIFPAIDIEKSGTRKDEKLISSNRLRLITTLRRVLHRMHFAEAMELLITKLDDVEKTDDFLKRFEIDPEAE